MNRAQRIDVLRRTLDELPRAIARVGGGHEGQAPDAGWSLVEVLTHLADAETVYGVRTRLLLTETDPVLQPYDQEKWAERYAPLDTAETALERWRVMREANLRLFDSLAEDAWSRSGRHPERGIESVEDQLRLMSDHDIGHLQQLAALA